MKTKANLLFRVILSIICVSLFLTITACNSAPNKSAEASATGMTSGQNVINNNDPTTWFEDAKDGGIKREDAEKIKVGMTFEETVGLIARPQRDIGSGVFAGEWKINTGEVLQVYYNKTVNEENKDGSDQSDAAMNYVAYSVEIKKP